MMSSSKTALARCSVLGLALLWAPPSCRAADVDVTSPDLAGIRGIAEGRAAVSSCMAAMRAGILAQYEKSTGRGDDGRSEIAGAYRGGTCHPFQNYAEQSGRNYNASAGALYQRLFSLLRDSVRGPGPYFYNGGMTLVIRDSAVQFTDNVVAELAEAGTGQTAFTAPAAEAEARPAAMECSCKCVSADDRRTTFYDLCPIAQTISNGRMGHRTQRGDDGVVRYVMGFIYDSLYPFGCPRGLNETFTVTTTARDCPQWAAQEDRYCTGYSYPDLTHRDARGNIVGDGSRITVNGQSVPPDWYNEEHRRAANALAATYVVTGGTRAPNVIYQCH